MPGARLVVTSVSFISRTYGMDVSGHGDVGHRLTGRDGGQIEFSKYKYLLNTVYFLHLST